MAGLSQRVSPLSRQLPALVWMARDMSLRGTRLSRKQDTRATVYTSPPLRSWMAALRAGSAADASAWMARASLEI